jgi:hypothetical protein
MNYDELTYTYDGEKDTWRIFKGQIVFAHIYSTEKDCIELVSYLNSKPKED